MKITFIVIGLQVLKNSLAYQMKQIDALQKDGHTKRWTVYRKSYIRRLTH